MQEKEQKISPFKRRLLQFIEHEGLSKRAFYESTGVSRGTLDNNSSLTEVSISKIFAAYERINPKWLIQGIGEMIKKPTNVVNEPIPKYGKGAVQIDPPNTKAWMEYMAEKDNKIFEYGKTIGRLQSEIEQLKQNKP